MNCKTEKIILNENGGLIVAKTNNKKKNNNQRFIDKMAKLRCLRPKKGPAKS